MNYKNINNNTTNAQLLTLVSLGIITAATSNIAYADLLSGQGKRILLDIRLKIKQL